MLVDENARANALNIENKLIKAPAGSGKTGLLKEVSAAVCAPLGKLMSMPK